MHIPGWVKTFLDIVVSVLGMDARPITDAERYSLDGMPTVCQCGAPLAARTLRRKPYNIIRIYCPAAVNWWEGKEHDEYEWGS